MLYESSEETVCLMVCGNLANSKIPASRPSIDIHPVTIGVLLQDGAIAPLSAPASKDPQIRSRGKMRQCNVGLPFERIAIDIARPFPVTDDGNRYIMVVGDYFTKWVEAYAIPNQEVTTVQSS